MKVNKNAITMRISLEEMGAWDSRYMRKSELISITEPTQKEWADYERARDALAFLRTSPYFQDGGPDERATIEPPSPRREYRYTETEKEWRERCSKLTKEQP